MTKKSTKTTQRKYDGSFKEDKTSNGMSFVNNTDAAAEMDRLRAELHRTEQESEILKKALAAFSRGT